MCCSHFVAAGAGSPRAPALPPHSRAFRDATICARVNASSQTPPPCATTASLSTVTGLASLSPERVFRKYALRVHRSSSCRYFALFKRNDRQPCSARHAQQPLQQPWLRRHRRRRRASRRTKSRRSRRPSTSSSEPRAAPERLDPSPPEIARARPRLTLGLCCIIAVLTPRAASTTAS